MYETYSAELAHHGILGQRWGVRRFQNEDGSLTPKGQKHYAVKEAKSAYKAAKKDLKKTVKYEKKNLTVSQKLFGPAGIKNLQRYKASRDNIMDKELNRVKAKADLAKAKHGEKGEMRAYRKEMSKTGIRESYNDTHSDYRSTKLFNKIQEQKGREYAEKVEKKVQNVAIAQLAGGTALMVGSAFVSAYLSNK